MIWILVLKLASGLIIPIETTEEACKLTASRFARGESVIKVYLAADYAVDAVEAVCRQEAGA